MISFDDIIRKNYIKIIQIGQQILITHTEY